MAENIRSNSAMNDENVGYGDKWHEQDGEDLLDWLEKGLVNVESVINMYKKQIAKPVKELKTYTDSYDDTYLLSAACPNCNHKLTLLSDYCPNCGQHLAWDRNKKIVNDKKSVFSEENT